MTEVSLHTTLQASAQSPSSATRWLSPAFGFLAHHKVAVGVVAGAATALLACHFFAQQEAVCPELILPPTCPPEGPLYPSDLPPSPDCEGPLVLIEPLPAQVQYCYVRGSHARVCQPLRTAPQGFNDVGLSDPVYVPIGANEEGVVGGFDNPRAEVGIWQIAAVLGWTAALVHYLSYKLN